MKLTVLALSAIVLVANSVALMLVWGAVAPEGAFHPSYWASFWMAWVVGLITIDVSS